MEFKDYFQNELIALRDLGREAATRNPGLGPFFDTPGRDPDIERILESFAFLGGRLRQKLDDELPEITHALFSLLWPSYLRPLPAASILQYSPTGGMTGPTNIPKGTLVESVPVEETRCTFQTAYDTDVLPLRITEQQFMERNGTIILAVRFTLTSGKLPNLPLSRLRFFFTGKEPIPQTLYFTLLKGVQEVRFVLHDAQMKEHVTAVLPPDVIVPVGFSKDEGLYPYSGNMKSGYRILQEYFCFPEKFLFVDISGLERGLRKKELQAFQTANSFTLHFVLNERPEGYESLQAENWNLFCTPVVNLFPFQVPSMSVEAKRREYKITPSPTKPTHFEVYSVDKVSQWAAKGKGAVDYDSEISLNSFLQWDKALSSYQLHIRPTLDSNGVETYISIDSNGPQDALIALELTCTNGRLPGLLEVGDICLPAGKGDASAVSFSNILPLTTTLPPPFQGDLLWQLISNMSLNYIPLTDAKALRAVLATYHFRALHDHKAARDLERTLQSIVSVTCTETDRIFKGVPLRGARTRVVLDPKGFSCEGAMYLFCAVLNEFLSLYATANSFHQLVTIGNQGKEYQWPARLASTIQ